MASLGLAASVLVGGAFFTGAAQRWGAWRAWGVSSALLLFLGVRSVAKRAMTYPREQKAKAISAPRGLEVSGLNADKELRFFCVDDQVMGGRSASAVTASPAGHLQFVGVINTAGGGFASCRTLGDTEPLGIPKGAQTLEITATGDGRQYKVSLHTADSWAMKPVWAHDFRTEPGVRSTLSLALRDFVPGQQGQRLKNAAPLDLSAVTGLGLGHSLYTADGRPNEHFGDGPFSLTVERIAFS